jgi:hypothetical protein
MKVAIADVLAAMDLAAAKALGQQQISPEFAGLNLAGKNPKQNSSLVIPGTMLVIEPQILSNGNALVEMKISVQQRDDAGEDSEILNSRVSFVRMILGNFFGGKPAPEELVFTSFSAN